MVTVEVSKDVSSQDKSPSPHICSYTNDPPILVDPVEPPTDGILGRYVVWDGDTRNGVN